MITKITPGPWTIDNSRADEFEGTQIWAEDVIIAHVVDDQHQNQKANAQAIAAVPDLIQALNATTEALKDIINSADNGQPYSQDEIVRLFIDAYSEGSAALKKAVSIEI